MYVIRIAKSSRWDRCGYIVQGFTFCCEKKIAHNKTSKFFFLSLSNYHRDWKNSDGHPCCVVILSEMYFLCRWWVNSQVMTGWRMGKELQAEEPGEHLRGRCATWADSWSHISVEGFYGLFWSQVECCLLLGMCVRLHQEGWKCCSPQNEGFAEQVEKPQFFGPPCQEQVPWNVHPAWH